MSEKFKASYAIDDGYVGKSRPQKFEIFANEIEDDMDEEELCEVFYDNMQHHFEDNISTYPNNLEEFLEWAKGVQNKGE